MYPPVPLPEFYYDKKAYSVKSRDEGLVPNFHPITSITINCNLVYNKISSNKKFLYTFDTGEKQFGELITVKP